MPVDILLTVVEIAVVIVGAFSLNLLIGLVLKAIAQRWFPDHPEYLKPFRRRIRQCLQWGCVVLGLGIAGANGWLIYQGKGVLETQRKLVQSIPPQTWIDIGIGAGKCLGILLLIKLVLPHVYRLVDKVCKSAQNADYITANDKSIYELFDVLKQILRNSAWIFALFLCSQLLQFPETVPTILLATLRAYFIFAIGLLVVKAIAVVVDTLDALGLQFSKPENVLQHYERFRYLLPTFKKCLEYICYGLMFTLIVRDISFLSWLAPYSAILIQVIAIFFSCSIVIEIANLIMEDLVFKTSHLTELQRKRRMTIIPLFKSFLKYFIYFVAGVAVLNLIRIDPTPILAGAGIAGIAIGFGAQNLINDIVCGFFILFENYYLVGDYIELRKGDSPSIEGIVEAIELRTTHIRHPDGQLQIIRNGEIGSVINYSKQYIYAKVDIPVPHHIDLDQIHKIVEEVGQQLNDECQDVLEPTSIEGLENFGEQNLVLRTLTRVKPGKHLYIQRMLRRMLKNACDRENIALQSSSV
jgi:moderate conductance mechanosensitive channel